MEEKVDGKTLLERYQEARKFVVSLLGVAGFAVDQGLVHGTPGHVVTWCTTAAASLLVYFTENGVNFNALARRFNLPTEGTGDGTADYLDEGHHPSPGPEPMKVDEG